jgi:hypothetical protein
LSPINYSASENANSDRDSVVSDHFYTSSGKIVQPPREWWKVYPSNDIYMEGFKRLSEMVPAVPEPKSDDEITLISRLDEVGFVIDMMEKAEPKAYWKEVNEPNGQL